MPLLQEATPNRDHLSNIKVESEKTTSLRNPPMSPMYPSTAYSHHQLAQQMILSQMLASQMGFRNGLPPPYTFPLAPLTFQANSPPSPPTSTTESLSPALLKARKLNNNNNNNNVVVVSSNSASSKPLKRKKEETETPISSPASSTISPPISESGQKDVNRDRPFTCETCNRSFGYKHVLQNHERTHTGEKPFECQECHKRFTRDHHLKTHMRLHTGERPYHCEHCDRQFVQVANLRRHLRVHTGERPYSCEHCQAKFSDSNQLKAHHLIHTNEKPFECERCHSRFRRRHHLLHHKCGSPPEEVLTPESDEPEDEPKVFDKIYPAKLHVIQPSILHAPSLSPMMNGGPMQVQVNTPVQTEPEDLSMSTGLHSHSSGDSPSSPSSRGTIDLEEDDPRETAAIFLQQRTSLTPSSHHHHRHSS